MENPIIPENVKINAPALPPFEQFSIVESLEGTTLSDCGLVRFVGQTIPIRGADGRIIQWRFVLGYKHTKTEDQLQKQFEGVPLKDSQLEIKVLENDETKRNVPGQEKLVIRTFWNGLKGDGQADDDDDDSEQEETNDEGFISHESLSSWKLSYLMYRQLYKSTDCYSTNDPQLEKNLINTKVRVREEAEKLVAIYRAKALDLCDNALKSDLDIQEDEEKYRLAIEALKLKLLETTEQMEEQDFWSGIYEMAQLSPTIQEVLQGLGAEMEEKIKSLNHDLDEQIKAYKETMVEKSISILMFFVVFDVIVETDEDSVGSSSHFNTPLTLYREGHNGLTYGLKNIKMIYDPNADPDFVQNWMMPYYEREEMEIKRLVYDEFERRHPIPRFHNCTFYNVEMGSKSEVSEDEHSVCFPHHYIFTAVVTTKDPSVKPCFKMDLELEMDEYNVESVPDITQLTYPFPDTVKVGVPWVNLAIWDGILKYNKPGSKTSYHYCYEEEIPAESHELLSEKDLICPGLYKSSFSDEMGWSVETYAQPFIQYSAAFGKALEREEIAEGLSLPSTATPHQRGIRRELGKILKETETWKDLGEQLDVVPTVRDKIEEQVDKHLATESIVTPISFNGVLITVVVKNQVFEQENLKEKFVEEKFEKEMEGDSSNLSPVTVLENVIRKHQKNSLALYVNRKETEVSEPEVPEKQE